MSDIAVVGAGSYGSCLAMLFGRAGHRVSLWCRNPETAAAMQRTRATEQYLPGHTLPEQVTVTSELDAAVRGKQFIVGVTPSHGIRSVLGELRARFDVVVVNAHPVLAVAETSLAGRAADAIVLTCEKYESRLPLVSRAQEKIAGLAPEAFGVVVLGASRDECLQ